MGFNLIYLWSKAEILKKYLSEIQNLSLAKPVIGERFNFSNLIDAIRKFQSRQTVGKVVININDEK
jgi:alcohol dehydrogenase